MTTQTSPLPGATEPAATAAPENNTGGFDLDLANIWDIPTPPPAATSAPQPQQTQQVNTDQQFDNYVSALNFTPSFSPQLQQKMMQGDFSELAQIFDASMKAVYKKAMTDSVKVAQNVARNESNNAVRTSTGVMDSREATRVLEATVPIASNPNVAPIARAVMQQHMRAGKSAQDAAKATKEFFAAMRTQPYDRYGLEPPKPTGGRGSPVDFQQEPEMDWLDFVKS